MKKLLFSFFLLTLGNITLFSQCSISYNNGSNVITNTPAGFLWGQGFVATCSGDLNYVEFISNSTGTVSAGTLNIYNGNSVTSSIYNQAFPAITIANAGDPIRITLTNSLPISVGNQYTFEFHVDNVDILADLTPIPRYNGGDAFQDGTISTILDFIFNVNITNSTGIKENSTSNLNLYPNPVQHTLFIDTEDQITNISIHSIDGRSITTSNTQDNSIDIAELSTGIYIALVKTNKGIIRRKILKE